MTDNQYLLQNYNCEWLDYVLPVIFAGIAIYLIYKAYKSWKQGSIIKEERDTLQRELEQAYLETNEWLEQ